MRFHRAAHLAEERASKRAGARARARAPNPEPPRPGVHIFLFGIRPLHHPLATSGQHSGTAKDPRGASRGHESKRPRGASRGKDRRPPGCKPGAVMQPPAPPHKSRHDKKKVESEAWLAPWPRTLVMDMESECETRSDHVHAPLRSSKGKFYFKFKFNFFL